MSGVLRGARVTTGSTGEDMRLHGTMTLGADREKHFQRGSQVNYYKDLGISTTPDQANAIRSSESEYKKAVDANQSKVDEARNQVQSQYTEANDKINQAAANIPGFKEALADAWSNQKKSFVKINVVNNSTGKQVIEGTYLLPRSVAESMAKESSLATLWGKDNNFYVDERTAKGGKHIGQELHDSLRNGVTDTYNKFVIANSPSISKGILAGKNQIAEARNKLSQQVATASGEVSSAQTQIDSATSKHAKDWQKVHDDYQSRKQTIADIYSKFKVKEPGK